MLSHGLHLCIADETYQIINSILLSNRYIKGNMINLLYGNKQAVHTNLLCIRKCT